MRNLVKSKEPKLRCGQCLHFKTSRHDGKDNLCTNLGVRSIATAPRCFTPNYAEVLKNPDEFVQVVKFFSSKTESERRVLLSIIQQKPKDRNFKMGQLLYLATSKRDYLSNYVAAYFVGYTSSKKIVLAGSPSSKTRGSMFFAYLESDEMLLTPSEWKVKRQELTSSGRVSDPTLGKERNITVLVAEDDYEIPTIDSALVVKKSTKLKKKGNFQILEF